MQQKFCVIMFVWLLLTEQLVTYVSFFLMFSFILACLFRNLYAVLPTWILSINHNVKENVYWKYYIGMEHSF